MKKENRNWLVTISMVPLVALFGYVAVGVLVLSEGPILIKLMLVFLSLGVVYCCARILWVGTTAELKKFFNWFF